MIRKLKFVLIPWGPISNEDNELEGKVLDSLAKPEFYLPTMAIVTFVLLTFLNVILNGKSLEMDNIGKNIGNCFFLSSLEALLSKVYFYIFAKGH